MCLSAATITPVQIDSLNSSIYSSCAIPKCLDRKIESFKSLNDISKEWHEKEYQFLKKEFNSLKSQEHCNKIELAKIYHFIQFGEYEQAIKIAHSHLNSPKKLDITFKAKIYNILGIAYQKMGDFTNAMQNYLHSKKLFIQNGEDLMATYPLGNLADIYLQLGESEKALEKNLEAFELSKQLVGEKRYYNTGWDLIRIAEILILQEKYDEAYEKIDAARELITLCSDNELKAKALSVYFEFLSTTGKINEAIFIQDQLKCEYSNQISQGTSLHVEHFIRELNFLVSTGEIKMAQNVIQSEKPTQFGGLKLNYLKAKGNLFEALGDLNGILETKQEIALYLENNFKSEITSYLNVMEDSFSMQTLHKENDQLRSQSKKQRSAINFILLLVFAFLLVSLLLASMFEKLKIRNRQLAEMNQSISQKNNELEQLNYTTTHDIKEPINTIYHFSNLLESKYGETLNPEVSKLFSIIQKASKDSQKQISGIQEYLRLGYQEEITSFNSNEMLKELLLDLKEVTKESNAKITHTILPTIRGNKSEIKTLFNHLILNAIHHSKPNQKIEIEISYAANDNYHLFNIIDNGMGISKEYQEKIFDLFQVLDTQKSDIRIGTGLANSKKIVELHQGEIWVNSKVGVGSTFSFTIKKDLA